MKRATLIYCRASGSTSRPCAFLLGKDDSYEKIAASGCVRLPKTTLSDLLL